jgi:DnaJ-class molecular chaperone
MIPFSQIANPPMPAYRPICGTCEGRGVVPVWETKSLEKCTACNGVGREAEVTE